jgi:hypothetical protein
MDSNLLEEDVSVNLCSNGSSKAQFHALILWI